MKSPMVYLREWGRATGAPQGVYWPQPDHVRLRIRLITEEAQEVRDALLTFLRDGRAGDRPNLAKELADLVYVVYGTAAELGIDLDEAIKRVHESNMTKDFSQPSGHTKAMKGEGYREPYMDDFGPIDATVAP